MKNKIFKYISLVLILGMTSILNGFSQELPAEQIHVHLQKNICLAGEAIHFKLYCLNSNDLKLSKISKVAYVELIGENGFPVAQTDIILEHGMGKGGFVISSQLPTGNYAINAYTHWMKTSSPDFINVSPLFIFNNQNISDSDYSNTTNLKSTFRDLKNNNLTLVKSEIKQDDISIHTKIEDLNRILKISITNNNIGIDSSYIFQLLSRKGKTLEQKIQFNQNNWETLLEIKDLKSPNYNIAIRNNKGQLIKTAVIHLANSHRGRFIEKPRITTKQRKKIKINLRLEELSHQDDSLFLLASIKLKEPQISSINIIDYMNLYSDFGANMLPYFNHIKKFGKQSWIAEKGIETVWLKNSNIYSVNANRYPEEEAYVIEGTVKMRKTKQAFTNENVFLSKIGGYADISPFCTNDQGKFYFNLPLKKGLHDISIQVKGRNDLDLAIKLKDKFNSEGFAPIPWKKQELKEKQLDFIKDQFENFRIRNIYRQETYRETKDTCLYRGQANFYGKSEHFIKIDDYIQLDSLEEYFHEFITTVKINYKKKKPHIYVYSPDIMRVFEQNPLLMFDGLILSDASKILNKNSKEIDKIEVVPYEYYYGSSHLYGIINVISKKQDCQLSELPKNTERYYLPLFTHGVEYINTSEYQQKNHADFRTDLLWEPNINLTKNKHFDLEFTTSDVKGEYELTVEGISEKGEPIVIMQSILVE
ncbi:hypothetical protein DWB61_12950 [Ancylomarina euxinus]|uniref:Macroglobulin domain-containing protein n=1 Tax=Ancylomarina euxinus TaxID=2283627 RepID=A0A425XYV8_9BACT|nr:hypothetical protein [Ancylomarina euxinus]MCZ4695691.1 hypothetical protein [Ancylomarina euxinus]MUP16005.1 hypothetical protein [Ancylomarina euxinus]RRG20251.1 hypothetical protein DWB61_12950 [Ancylomarina euxinus]